MDHQPEEIAESSDCGVYQIVCKPTNQVYIGFSWHLKRRKSLHFTKLKQGKHVPRFQDAYDKYGKKAFEFHVIKLFPAGEYGYILETEILRATPRERLLNATIPPIPHYPVGIVLYHRENDKRLRRNKKIPVNKE